MRKSTKCIATIVLIVLCTLQMSIMAFAKTPIPSPSKNGFVNDFANVLTLDEEIRLIENATALFDNYGGTEVVISTMKTLKDYTLEDLYSKDFLETCSEDELKQLEEDFPRRFATEMYNQYGIGTNDMGILILLIVEDGAIEVSTGKSMEVYISQSKAGEFIDEYALDSFNEHNFSEGLINLQEAFISEIENKITPSDDFATVSSDSADNFPPSLVIFFVCLGAFIIFISIAYLLHNTKEIQKEKQSKLDAIEKEFINEKNNIIQKYEAENSSLRQKSSSEIDSLNKKISDLSQKNKMLNSRLQDLKDSHSKLKYRYEKMLQLYPNADNEVSKLIDEEIRYQKKIEEERLQREIEDNKNSANIAMQLINSIISHINIGKADDLSELNEAKSIYNGLPNSAKEYADQSIISKLNSLIAEATNDANEEERRRKEKEFRRIREENERRRKREEEIRRTREEDERRRKREEDEKRNSYHNSSHSSSNRRHNSNISSSTNRSKPTSIPSHKLSGGQSRGAGASRRFKP